MDITLNEEQSLIAQTALEFAREHADPARVRALETSEHGFDPIAWKRMAELGWAGVLIPELHGGSAFGHQGLGQIMEAAGRTLTASPLVATVLLGALRERHPLAKVIVLTGQNDRANWVQSNFSCQAR